jgi:large subunit ribosomal protein L5
MALFAEKYQTEVVPAIKEELGLKNPLSVPRLEKVVVNMGLGIVDKDALKTHVDNLARITGQRPVITKARKSISNFKLRQGMNIGAKVTLRGARMYEFLNRLINAALPRIRDFRGLPRESFDGKGNYTMGIRELEIFPEIDPNEVTAAQGLDITIVTTTRDDQVALRLLDLLGIPFASE